MAVQNFNGGILIDTNGFTGVEGLYAAGEITGGVHGSDRPGGNNLTDTQVFGYRAGRAAADHAASAPAAAVVLEEAGPRLEPDEEERALIAQSERLYYQNLTVVRNSQGLQRVLDFTGAHLRPGISAPLRNRLPVGQTVRHGAAHPDGEPGHPLPGGSSGDSAGMAPPFGLPPGRRRGSGTVPR